MDEIEKSLVKSCLQVVAKHIDRFSYAFNTTTDAVLKRNFEYLQLCYSDELLRMIREEEFREEWLPLLINKYIRELNLSVLDHVDERTIIQKIAEVGEGLAKVSFSVRPIFLQHRSYGDIFPYLKNVTVLSMEFLCHDDALRIIVEHCPYVVELNIAFSVVTNAGLRRYLIEPDEKTQAPKLNLQKLNLLGTDVDDLLIAITLMTFPELQVLETNRMPCILHTMHQTCINQNNFSDVIKLKLTHLDTYSCSHLSTSPELLKLYALVCPDVIELKTGLTDAEQVSTLAAFTKVKHIELEHDLFPQPNVNSFLKCRGFRLTVLRLNGFILSVEELLKSCPLLEELRVENSIFLPLNGEVVPKELKFLEKFFLKNAHFKNATMVKSLSAILSSAHQLKEIRFCNCRFFTDEIKDIFTRCCIRCPLQNVHFCDCDFNFSLLQSVLLNSRSLKSLYIDCPTVLAPDRPTYEANIDHLAEIASSLMNKPRFDIEREIDMDRPDLDIFPDVPRGFNWGIY